MNNLTFNIGLNVGTSEPTSQLSRTLTLLNNIGHIVNLRTEIGTYNGMQERTLIADVISHRQSVGNLIKEISHMSTELDQDAIAVEINTIGHLIYRRDWDYEQHPFSNQYFIK